MKTKSQFEEGMWTLTCLMQDALIRRLKDEAAGGEPLKPAELSPITNYIKLNTADAPNESFNRVFEDD